ncbi:MAG: efflux transporter outer membrane subunit [Rhodospirillales bacterium]
MSSRAAVTTLPGLAGLVLLALGGCVVGPDYQPPATPRLPTNWEGANAAMPAVLPDPSAASAADGTASGDDDGWANAGWWASFNDPLLPALIEDALTANYDLQRAVAAIGEARAAQRRTQSGLFPTVDHSTAYERGRGSQTLTSVGGGGTTGLSSASLSGDDRFTSQFAAGWEIDLFGKVQRGIEAASAGVDAAAEAAAGVRLSLAAEVGRAYVDVRSLQQRIDVTHRQIASQQETVEIGRARAQAGLGAGLDVVRAEAELATTEAQLPPLQAALAADIHRLGVLTGQPPAALTARLVESAPIPVSAEALRLGIPADLIRRRPDIRNSERLLAQATANVGVAEADRYPTLSLNGTIGIGSRNLDKLANTDSLIWSIGPQLDIPVLDGGRRRAEVNVQQARVDQAAAAYQHTILVALEDVENALAAYAEEVKRQAALARSVQTSRDALALATELWVRGLTPFLDVLVAQRTLYTAEINLAVSEASLSTDLVTLYQAIGGGWDVRAGIAAR